MDRQTDGHLTGQTDVRRKELDRRTDRQTGNGMDGEVTGQLDRQTDGWMDT